MDKSNAERLKALWKSGRDKFQSFFTVLNEVRAEIGDDELATYCRNELAISLSIIMKAKGILREVDEMTVKEDFAEVVRAEKEKAEAEKRKRQLEAIAHREEVARKKAEAEEAERKAAEEKVAKNKIKYEEKKRQDRQKKAGADKDKKTAQTKGGRLIKDIDGLNMKGIENRLRTAQKMCEDGMFQWREGSIVRATLLAEARAKIPSDPQFGAWLVQNEPELSPNDRKALINLGKLEHQELRDVFNNTERTSYRYIWEEYSGGRQAVSGIRLVDEVR